MKKFTAIALALLMILSLAACGGKTEPDAGTSANDAQTTENTDVTEETENTDVTEETENTDETEATENTGATEETETAENIEVEGDPVEYEQSYWEEKYPDYMFCPFYIEENGEEKSYYWPMGYEGLDGTIGTWIDCPFNWNGWHRTDDGSIVNKDETLKITDNWASGDEGMSSCCTVTTETYVKDAAAGENTTVSED